MYDSATIPVDVIALIEFVGVMHNYQADSLSPKQSLTML